MDHLKLDLRQNFSASNRGNRYNPSCSFQNFPLTVGWCVNTTTGDLNEAEAGASGNRALPFRDLMQSWLFFGLITAVVFDDNHIEGRQFDASKFDHQDKGKITTEKLPKILEEWRDWEISQDGKPGQKMRMIRAQLALDLARKVVHLYCSADSPKNAGRWKGRTHLDKNVALSLMVIGETLSIAKARIIGQIKFSVRGWFGDATLGWGIPQTVIDAMEKEGWCPRTVQLLKSQLRDNASAFLTVYASHESGHFQGHKIAGCVKDQPCKVKSVRNQEYATQHHPECLHNHEDATPEITSQGAAVCSNKEDDKQSDRGTKQITCHWPCHEMLGVPIDKVLDLIKDDKIPLVKFKDNAPDGELVLEVTDTSREPDYATISHVWSDGYGNRKSNALYRCQIEYFRRLLREAQVHRARYRRGYQKDKPEPLPFWIDTLLIPVGSEEIYKTSRKKAIHQIYTVFSRAKYTIVVDNGLSTMSWNDQDYTTTAMRILASGWMRRLWTLQEAYLSRKLLFAFKDWDEDYDENERFKDPPLVDLDEIEALYNDSRPSLLSDLPSVARSYYDNLLGPDRKARNDKNMPMNGMSLIASVWRAAQWRNTSHTEHETLALATLLNLDLNNKSFGTADLMKPDNEASQKLDIMMRDFWLSLEESSPGAIPPGIIFLPGPRIQISGFGWAPKSWMLAHRPDYPDPVALLGKPAVLSPGLGLQVEFPGFLLHCEDRDAILGQTDGKGFKFPCDNSLTEYYRVTWDDIGEYSMQRGIIGDNRSEDLAIILCRPKPGQLPEIGLLVEIHATKQEKWDLGQDSVRRVFAVYMRRRVKVGRETGDVKLETKVEEIMNRHPKEQSRIICGEVLDEDQKWIVDCRIDSAEKKSAEKGAIKPATFAPSAPASPSIARSTVMGLRSMQDRGSRSGPDRPPTVPSSQPRISGQTLTEDHTERVNGFQASSTHSKSYNPPIAPSTDEAPGPGSLQKRKTWAQLLVNPWA